MSLQNHFPNPPPNHHQSTTISPSISTLKPCPPSPKPSLPQKRRQDPSYHPHLPSSTYSNLSYFKHQPTISPLSTPSNVPINNIIPHNNPHQPITIPLNRLPPISHILLCSRPNQFIVRRRHIIRIVVVGSITDSRGWLCVDRLHSRPISSAITSMLRSAFPACGTAVAAAHFFVVG